MTYEEYFADKYPDVDVEDKVNSVDDEQKKSADSSAANFYALAMKRARSGATASKQKKHDGGFYYGMVSGAMGVFAATALYVACKSKKTVQANEEALI